MLASAPLKAKQKGNSGVEPGALARVSCNFAIV